MLRTQCGKGLPRQCLKSGYHEAVLSYLLRHICLRNSGVFEPISYMSPLYIVPIRNKSSPVAKSGSCATAWIQPQFIYLSELSLEYITNYERIYSKAFV